MWDRPNYSQLLWRRPSQFSDGSQFTGPFLERASWSAAHPSARGNVVFDVGHASDLRTGTNFDMTEDAGTCTHHNEVAELGRARNATL